MSEAAYLEIAGQRHPIRLTLRAVKELNERFGGIENMAKVLSNTSDLDTLLDALNDTLKILMKAGRAWASLAGEELPPALAYDPIDVLDMDVTKTLNLVMSTMRGDTEREVETVPKNGEAARIP